MEKMRKNRLPQRLGGNINGTFSERVFRVL